MFVDGSAHVRWYARRLRFACACLIGAATAFVAEIVLARVMPDAPPYLFLDAPGDVAEWVTLDRFLFSVVCLGLLVAGAVAGAAAKRYRAAFSMLLVSSSVGLIGLLLQGVFWGTSSTAEDLGVAVAWLGPASLIAAMLTALAGAGAVAAGLALGLLARRAPITAP